MIVSTKGRYALRVMVCFAQRGGNEYIPLKEIAESEGISQKYLESIMTTLSKAGFVDAVHGKGGGYRLTREPEDYTLWEILELAEGDLAPVTCLQPDAPVCQRAGECRTLGVWQGYYKLTQDYFSHITLADLMNAPQGDNYVI